MSSDKTTILTCPSCATRYNVKASAIPPEGRTVRCAACGNKWHVDPDPDDAAEAEPLGETTSVAAPERDEPRTPVAVPTPPPVPEQEAPPPPPPIPERSEERVWDEAPREPEALLSTPPEPEVQAAVEEQQAEQAEIIDERVTPDPFDEPAAADAGFTGIDPIEDHADDDERPRSRAWMWIVGLVVLVGAAIAALFTVAPPEWRAQLGVGAISAEESPFDVILTRQNMSTLESGQRMLSVTGRVVNVTEENAAIPPIHAELRDANEAVLHEWTIAPPAPSLGPGESATFNSAEADIPDGGSRIVMVVGG